MDSKRRGFTLVEVMVALLIVAVALPALLLNIGAMSTATANARETAVAHWVAENVLQEIYLTQQMQRITPRGRQADDMRMAGQVWDWQTETEQTPVEGFIRVWVRVRAPDSDYVLAELSGFFLE